MMTDLAVVICPLVAFLLYYNTLNAGFVYDDKRAILDNADVATVSPLADLMSHDFWGTPLNASGSHGSYRPLITLSFRWTAQLVGLDRAHWHHWINVMLHCAVTSAVTLIAGRVSLFLFRRDYSYGSYVSGLLFAAHPVHCEAVAGLVGRADMVCTLFFLAGLFTYTKRNLTGTLILTCAAFLSKEYGIMLTPVCLLYDLVVFTGSARIKRTLFYWAVLTAWSIALVTFRFWLSGFHTPQFARADNPTAASPSWTTRSLTFLYLPVFHFGLLLWPRWLSFDWSMDAIQPVTSLEDIRNLATLIFYTVLAVAIRKIVSTRHPKYRIVFALAVITTTIPFLPATNLFFYVGFVVAERILYLPSVGFCLLVGLGVQMLIKQRQSHQMIFYSILILLLALGWRTIQRNGDWIDEEHLYRSGIEINPPKAHGNLGVVFQQSGRLAEAEWNFKRALSYRPNMADVHHNLGNLFQQQSRYEESLQAYNKAIHFRPQLAEAYSEKAKVLYKLKRWAEAEKTLLDCTRLKDDFLRDSRAHQTAKVSATILLGDLLSKNSSREKEAENWLLRARRLAPKNPLVYYQLGEFLSARSRHNEAAEVLIQAAEMDPNNVAWTVAAAHALHDASRNVEAEVYFRRAVNLFPMDISHRLNLGAVLHVQGKLDEAEQVYLKALHLSPNHPLTTVNLRRLRNSLLKMRSSQHDNHKCNQSLT